MFVQKKEGTMALSSSVFMFAYGNQHFTDMFSYSFVVLLYTGSVSLKQINCMHYVRFKALQCRCLISTVHQTLHDVRNVPKQYTLI